MSEAQVLSDIDHVAQSLAKMFAKSFPYLDMCDLEQEVRLEACKVLQKGTFDPSKKLAPYIFAHCRRRLLNKRRNEFFRPDCPCSSCNSGSFCGPENQPCERFQSWLKRNRSKAGLRASLQVDKIDDENEPRMKISANAERDVEEAELAQLIDEQLPVELRSDYLSMLAGVKVPSQKRKKVQQAVLEIIQAAGLATDMGLPEEEAEGVVLVKDVPSVNELVAANGCDES